MALSDGPQPMSRWQVSVSLSPLTEARLTCTYHAAFFHYCPLAVVISSQSYPISHFGLRSFLLHQGVNTLLHTLHHHLRSANYPMLQHRLLSTDNTRARLTIPLHGATTFMLSPKVGNLLKHST